MTTVNSNCGCCKTCRDCPNCYDLDIEKVRQYLYAIEQKMAEYNVSYLCISDWGYACKPVTYDQFEKLTIFRNYLKHYYDSLRFGYNSGMCPDEVQTILEQVSKLVSLTFHPSETYSYVYADDSKFDSWVLNNPYCVAYEDWERHLVKACFSIGVRVTKIDQTKELLVKIKSIPDPCKFLYTVSVYNVANQCITTKVKVNKKECRLDYDMIVKEYKCDMSFDTYVKLLECNMTPKVISSFLSCDLDVNYNVKTKCPEVIINSTSKVQLCNLDVNVFSNNVDKQILAQYAGETMTDFEVDQLIESYVNECELIKNQING